MNEWHVYPNRDQIEHDIENDDCVCGPNAERVPTDDGDGWVITHHSLDGRERHE